MSFPCQTREYSNELHKHTRQKCKEALSSVIKQEKNIKIIEQNIHKISEKESDYETIYKKNIYQAICDIRNGLNIKDLLENIKNNMIGWKHPIYKDIFNRLQEYDEFIIKPFEVEEGVTECKKCGSKRVFTFNKQTRSSDEPTTTFANCAKCKTHWTYSG